MSSLPPDVVALLESERTRPGPTPSERERLIATLDAAIRLLPPGGVGGGGDAGPPPTLPTVSASSASAFARIAGTHPYATAAICVALGGVLGASIDRSVMHTPTREVVYVDHVVVAAPEVSAAVAPPEPDSSTSAPCRVLRLHPARRRIRRRNRPPRPPTGRIGISRASDGCSSPRGLRSGEEIPPLR